MLFRAIFSHWVDTEQPALDHLAGKDFPDDEFLVEASSMDEAKRIARQYEGLETHVYEGIGKLKEVVIAAESDKHRLSPIIIYKRFLRNGTEKNAGEVSSHALLKVSVVIMDYLQSRGLSAEKAKNLAWDIMKDLERKVKSKVDR